MNRLKRRDPDSTDPVKDAAVAALKRVLDPLFELMFDAGITVHEFNTIARETAVRVSTRRIVKELGRVSKSRVAIMTGLPRSEVTRILKSEVVAGKSRAEQHPARRVLFAWHDDPRFLDTSGDPAVLPIFGKRRSFESLVARHGGGIPVRAMLDELTQTGTVERLDDQTVRAKARVPVISGRTSRSIAAVGERGKDLLETLAHNVRQSSQPLFEATAVIDDADPDMVALIRREIAEQGMNFINGASSLLNRSQFKRGSQSCRLGVTVYYFQEGISVTETPLTSGRGSPRKNLRRRRNKPIPTNDE